MKYAAAWLALAGCFVTSDESGERCGGTSCAPGSLIWSSQASSTDGSVTMTAVATSPGEPPWLAGGFSTDLQIETAGVSTPNPDFRDAFVARVEARDLPQTWLGLADATYPQLPAGIFPDDEEGAVLITYGEVPGSVWRIAATRIDRTGHEVQTATLAEMTSVVSNDTAAVTALDGAGWPVVAITGAGLRIPPQIFTARAVVLRVMQNQRTQKIFDQPGVEITSIAPDTRDTLVIGGRFAGTPPGGWPSCPEVKCGFAAIIDSREVAGTRVLRLEIYRATLGADVLGVGSDGAGRLTVLGMHEGEAIEPGFAGPPWPRLWLRFAMETDAVSTALSFDENLDLAGGKLVATDKGAVVALAFAGSVEIDSEGVENSTMTSDGVGLRDMVIAEYDADFDATGWHLLVRSDGDTQVSALAVEGSQVAVGGNFVGQLSTSNGTLLDRTGPGSQGFALELRR